MYYLKKILIIGFMLFSVHALSQSECQEDIDKANKLFDDGAFREAEKLTKQILETCDLNKTQENELLKLMASIYYEMDELELGDEYVAQFMNKNPYYIVSKRNDPVQFREAVDKFKSFPRFEVGLRGGLPLGQIITDKIYPVFDSANYDLGYSIKPVLKADLDLCWNINNYISINLGGGIRIQKLLHQVEQYSQLYLNYEEKFISSNFPLCIGVKIPVSNAFEAKILLGGELEMFMSGSYNYFYTGSQDITSQYTIFLNRKKDNIKLDTDERSKTRIGALAGIRLVYKFDKIGIYADCRYVKEFNLYNNPDKRYSNQDLLLSNNYTVDDIILENLDVSLGVMYRFSYKVKSKY